MTDTSEGHWWYEEYKEEYEYLQRHPELVRLFLYIAGLSDQRQLPELASSWLSELAEVGLQELERDQEAPLKQADPERPVLDPQEGELYPVWIGDHRQTFWLKLDGPRTGVGDKGGYRLIKVLDKPLRTQTAIIALLTTLEANPIDVERLREALSRVDQSFIQSIDKGPGMTWWSWYEPSEESVERSEEESDKLRDKLQLPKLRYVLSLLRYYRPSFDELPHEEQLGLIEEACNRVNTFLDASNQLVGFLEYGELDADLRVAAENANRDVKAAMLKDVEGLSDIKVAERFGLTISKKYRNKNEHRGVGIMAQRGRRMLENALGKDGWQRQIEAMKAEGERYRKLSLKEQAIQMLVDDNVPFEDARRQVEEVNRKAKEYKGEGLRTAWLLPDDPYEEHEDLP